MRTGCVCVCVVQRVDVDYVGRVRVGFVVPVEGVALRAHADAAHSRCTCGMVPVGGSRVPLVCASGQRTELRALRRRVTVACNGRLLAERGRRNVSTARPQHSTALWSAAAARPVLFVFACPVRTRSQMHTHSKQKQLPGVVEPRVPAEAAKARPSYCLCICLMTDTRA